MRCITLLDDKVASFHLDRKKVIFSHAYRGSSRSLPGVTTHVKPSGFKQLNWRIRENLSRAINNGSWYKLSLLVSEDAMTVPATCTYSVWRLAQNSRDMSPWNKHRYFRFYKLIVGKVINRLNLSCTLLTTVPCKIFRYFVPITKLLWRRFLVFLQSVLWYTGKLVWKGSRRIRDEHRRVQKPQSSHQGALKLCANAPTLGR